ncbi:MAG: sugar phosphate nucleotidyltransferase, partial [Planctomycetota bacterium]
GIPSNGRDCLASMGLYIFKKQVMIDLLENTDYQDFGKEVFPGAIDSRKVQVHLFDGYWEDIGTIRAFYEANLSLAGKAPPFELGKVNAPIYSRPRFLPPTVVGDDVCISGSLIADGCRIGSNVKITNSVIGLRTVIGDNVTIKDSVVMGADFIEDRDIPGSDHMPVGIGDHSTITGAILDKNCRIGSHVSICNEGNVQSQGEDEALQVRDGISIVIKNGVVENGYRF